MDVEALLKPISDSSPAGELPARLPAFSQLKADRSQQQRIVLGLALDPITAMPLGPEVKANWTPVIRAEQEILRRQSKSLEVAVWLAEDLVLCHGLRALPAGIGLVRELQDRYWTELHPRLDGDGDPWERAGILASLGPSLSRAVQAAPLVTSADSGASFSFADFSLAREGNHPNKLSVANIQAAAAQAPAGHISALLEAARRAVDEISGLEGQAGERYSEEDIEFLELRGALSECIELLASWSHRTTGEAATEGLGQPRDASDGRAAAATAALAEGGRPAAPVVAPPTLTVPDDGPSSSLLHAQALSRAGDYKGGLRILQAAVDQARSGRQRFLCRLELAEFCLEGGQLELARPLLADLMSTAEKRTLHEWEEPRIWARLIAAQHTVLQSPQKKPENSAAQALFETLCRVDIERAFETTRSG